MTERRKPGRGLADISHYFITEPKTEKPAEPVVPEPAVTEAVAVVAAPTPVEPAAPELQIPAKQYLPQHLFLLGSGSLEARALVAANLACSWSSEGTDVEMVEGEKKIPNSHFLMGGLFPQGDGGRPNGHPLQLRLDAARTISLSSWEHPRAERGEKPRQIIWNGQLPSLLENLRRVETTPRVLVVLEPEREKLMEAYLEVRQASTARPDALFGALVYARGNGDALQQQQTFHFFQEMCLKYLRVSVKDCGRLPWDLTLAKSILSRLPAVLLSEESAAKEALHSLAKTWRD